jgi:hypothetical protein
MIGCYIQKCAAGTVFDASYGVGDNRLGVLVEIAADWDRSVTRRHASMTQW